MGALHSLGHAGGSTGVEDARKALGGVVKPWRRLTGWRIARQRQHIERRQIAELLLSPGENDHWPGVVEHVVDEGVRQAGVEKHQRTAGLENTEVSGHDLPVVLRHGHGHDLVRAREEGRKGRGHVFGSRVELSEGQGFPGVGNLQRGEVRVFPGRAAEDLAKPPDTLLMGNIYQVIVIKHLGQAVGAGVRLAVRHRFRRPQITPPRHIRQRKENYQDGY